MLYRILKASNKTDRTDVNYRSRIVMLEINQGKYKEYSSHTQIFPDDRENNSLILYGDIIGKQ